MKIAKYFSFCSFLFLVSMTLSSCGGNTATDDKSGKEYSSLYICPMHCEGSGSEKAGKCPVCKMDYVANKEHPKYKETQGHEGHDHSHDGHDHSHEGHQH